MIKDNKQLLLSPFSDGDIYNWADLTSFTLTPLTSYSHSTNQDGIRDSAIGCFITRHTRRNTTKGSPDHLDAFVSTFVVDLKRMND